MAAGRGAALRLLPVEQAEAFGPGLAHLMAMSNACACANGGKPSGTGPRAGEGQAGHRSSFLYALRVTSWFPWKPAAAE